MINIQKSYSLYIGYIQSYSVCFGSIQSTLVIFGPHWPYSVYFISIWSTLILFGPFCSLWSTSIGSFSPLWSYLVHSINFGSIWSTLVLFCPLQSYSIQFGHIRSYMFLFGSLCPLCPNLSIRSLFDSIQSTSVLFSSQWFIVLFRLCPLWSLRITSIQFGPL